MEVLRLSQDFPVQLTGELLLRDALRARTRRRNGWMLREGFGEIGIQLHVRDAVGWAERSPILI